MKLANERILLTGATGGIGAATAAALLAAGASVLLSARGEASLLRLREQLGHANRVATCAADLTDARDRERLCAFARDWRGGIGTVINNAGTSCLRSFEAHDAAALEQTVAINLLAPLQLSRELLPHLVRQPRARIVNVGSVMGAIGFPGYGLYCATKFGLRGFSEALRRELADTCVSVHYLAPRATRTAMNSDAVVALNVALGTRMDPPQRVARALVRLLERGQASAVIGWPERFFVRLNQVLPSVVDRALRKQLPIIRQHATAARGVVDASSVTQIERKTA